VRLITNQRQANEGHVSLRSRINGHVRKPKLSFRIILWFKAGYVNSRSFACRNTGGFQRNSGIARNAIDKTKDAWSTSQRVRLPDRIHSPLRDEGLEVVAILFEISIGTAP